jgi:hypothetical protein
VAFIPLASPAKYASAIEQKKGLAPDTSVKGKLILAPPQVPVVAYDRVDSSVMLTTNETSRIARIAKLVLILIRFSVV